jgi:hypothetical protein
VKPLLILKVKERDCHVDKDDILDDEECKEIDERESVLMIAIEHNIWVIDRSLQNYKLESCLPKGGEN